LSEPLNHSADVEVVSVHLNQSLTGGLLSDRKLAFIDANRDLYLVQIHDSKRAIVKLAGVCV